MRPKALLTLAASTMLVLPSHCDAGSRRARRAVVRPQPQPQYTHPVYYAPTEPRPAQPAPDQHGFVAWLNEIRASYGLGRVVEDANLDAWAAANNAQQLARGMGHHVMGPARRQNSAMGDYASIGAMWMASPAHRAALLDPTITSVGLAGAGAYWTFNAR